MDDTTRRVASVASGEDPTPELRIAVPGAAETLRCTRNVRVGRAASNDIVLDHEIVSSQHLEISRTPTGWDVHDLGSTNGTYLNDVRITRAPLAPRSRLRLGSSGPELLVTMPEREAPDTPSAAERYLADAEPSEMSPHTEQIRAAVKGRISEEAHSWRGRVRRLRVFVGVLLVAVLAAGAYTAWQERRIRTMRVLAEGVFNTMKAVDLDLRRLRATAGPDAALEERRARLQSQYDALVRTLGIYGSATPNDVQLIYRTVHRLGESEATVPVEFVDAVRAQVARWKAADLDSSMARATRDSLGPLASPILRSHHLPQELLYIALQESKFDVRAVGPQTRLGIPKGMWQLMPATAEAYGLQLGPLQGERSWDPIDERYDVAKATGAAARYLSDLYETDAQASGLLVVAAYNMGETRLLKLIRSLPESPVERNFWSLLEKHGDQIPAETRDYVFRVVSAAVIGANPRLFGYQFEPPLGASPP